MWQALAEPAARAAQRRGTVVRRSAALIMDINMPELNGIEATRALTRSSPHVNVLILTMFDDDASVFRAMRVGARCCLLKGAGEQEIQRAVQDVAAGPAIAHVIDFDRRTL